MFNEIEALCELANGAMTEVDKFIVHGFALELLGRCTNRDEAKIIMDVCEQTREVVPQWC